MVCINKYVYCVHIGYLLASSFFILFPRLSAEFYTIIVIQFITRVNSKFSGNVLAKLFRKYARI